MRLPGFIGGSATSQSPIAAMERTVNWYVEPLPRTGKNEAALYPTPGQRAIVQVPDVGTRALFAMNGRVHAVMGGTVYEVFPGTATATSRGSVPQDGNPAQIVSNGAAGGALLVVSGGALYYVNLATNVLSAVTGLPAGHVQVGMLDGYFISFNPTTAKVYVSPLNDSAGVWDPTQFAQRSIAPDPWTSMLAADRLGVRELWLVGEQTGEVWYDAGNFPFPFAPIQGAVFRYGCAARWSLAVADTQVMWLSRNADGAGIVVAAKGYSPQRVSTAQVETAIASYARIDDAEAFSYQDRGHTFYVLRFPSASATWVYDTTTNLWHERGTWDSANNTYVAWKPRVHAYADGGYHLTGEAGTGIISALDATVGAEPDGSPIRRLRRAPGFFNEARQFTYKRFQVELEVGLGLVSGQGSNPQVMLRTSDNGGKTWSNERRASAGKIGAYDTRVFWTRLGTARDRVFEVTVSDPIPWRVIDAYVNNTAPPQGGQ